jgi:hypothetical protein
MARFTAADLELVEEAIVTVAVEGYVELSIAGQQVRRYDLDQLLKVRDAIKQTIGTSDGAFFIATQQLVSPGCGG